MPDEILVQQCSPTLAGLKTGSLFTVRFDDPAEFKRDIRNLNKRFAKKGLRLIPLRYGGGSALLYLYRPEHLKRDLADIEAEKILKERGYTVSTPEKCLVTLIQNFRLNNQFPHEIGLFLGYPPEDVRGFIENKAEKCKCIGCWKVYGDEEKAQKTFCRYKKCTRLYCEQLEKGKSIEQLTVAV